MLAAPASGSGKTTLACGLLLALRRLGRQQVLQGPLQRRGR